MPFDDWTQVDRLFLSARLDEALAAVEALGAAGEAGDEARCLAWRRRLLANLGDFSAAAEAARRVTELRPEEADDRLRLAEILVRCGRYQPALELALAVAGRSPVDPRALTIAVEAALAEPGLRPALAGWAARQPDAGGAAPCLGSSPATRGGSRSILLPANRFAGSLGEATHPDFLRTVRSAEGFDFVTVPPDPPCATADFTGRFAHGVRVFDALRAVHPLIDAAAAARFVAHRFPSLLDGGDGAALDLLTLLPMTLGQRPYILLFDVVATLFQPLLPFNRLSVSAAETPLYWIVRAFLETPRCVAVYSPYQTAAAELGQFFCSPAIERKTVMVDHVTPTLERHRAVVPAAPRAERAGSPPTLLFTTSALEPAGKFLRRGGLYVLCAFRTLAERFPGLRLTLRSPLPDLLAPELRAFARSHPGIRIIEEALDNAGFLRLFHEADIFLSPAAAFYMNSTYTAMSAGAVPVISDVFGSRDLVEDGRNGVLLPLPDAVRMGPGWFEQDLRPFLDLDRPGDPAFFDVLCSALHGLLAEPERRLRLGQQAAADAAAGFPRRPRGTSMAAILERGLHDAEEVMRRQPCVGFPAAVAC